MRVLIADDDPVLQAIARAVLEPEGYELLQAADGTTALDMYRHHEPDIVLTDYDMPGMDGLELCRRIQALHSDRYVPIVIFTGAAQPGLLRDSLEAGAIEFLTKPFQPDELRCRVKAIAELAELHNAVLVQKAQDDEELLVVKHVLDRLIEPGLRELPPSFHMETLPTRRINGDACTYSQGLPGVHFGLLCDATGHGLMAGISTIPVIQAFLSMTRRDIPLEHVFTEINSKLLKMLPTGRFACVLLFRLDLHQHVLSVLNAGFPEALLRRNDGSLRAFHSRNLPAGVHRVSAADLVLEFSDIQEGERFFAYSDGLQEVFEEQEIHDRLLSKTKVDHEAHRVFLRSLLRTRVQDLEQHDDITWALWEVPRRPVFGPSESTLPQEPTPELKAGLQTAFTLAPPFSGLKDLVPNLLLIMGQQGVDQSTAQLLGLLITEALANAVDHGLLGLSSSLKLEEGFEAYEAERNLRIETATSGQVRIALAFLEGEGPRHPVRAVQVEVEDSGPGFDWRAWTAEEDPEHPRPFGRGLTLIRALAVTVAFNEAGNQLRFTVPLPEA